MNVELLRRIQKEILEEPLRINMDKWAYCPDETEDPPPCGTVACIAGWAIALSRDLRGEDLVNYLYLDVPACGIQPFGAAIGVLSLGFVEAGHLFFVGEWPKKFIDALTERLPGTPGYARVVSDRIDFFIDTAAKYGSPA